MDRETKIVDLTLSDEETCHDCELLPLHERLLLKQNEIRKRGCSNDDLPFQKQEEANKNFFASDESSNDELPDISHILAVKNPSRTSDTEVCNAKIFKSVFKSAEKPAKISSNTADTEECSVKILTGVSKPAKKPCVRKQNVDETKEQAKQERIKIREEKKQEKELAKALKASEKEIQKSTKPDECLKNMKVAIDQSIIFENESEDIFSALDEANLKYNVEENSVHQSVMWYRTIIDVSVDSNQVVKTEREELENTLLLVVSCEQFLKMVHVLNQKSKGKNEGGISLSDYITNIKTINQSMNITCVIVGLEKYQRSLKGNAECDEQLKKLVRQTSKTAIDEAIVEVHVQAYVNFIFLNTMRELGELIARFTKAIAEAPVRKQKFTQKCQAFSWYADADSSCPVKLGKDGSGFLELWRQQIQQFNNVGPEVAEAIVARYPSLHLLLQAYDECNSTKEAEQLLQDIVVRRNYGPLGTQRRIGPELSFKIHTFFSSNDGNQILQR